ncbi:signal peptidase I [Streptomyces sp. CAU 1734]|uniref:signal peptidase I n=1 Tax=Streptomyces sp. CAU 1734 TaxID=3140360 RepID=UPI003260FA4E
MGRRGRPPGRRDDAGLPAGTGPAGGGALPGGRAERRRLARKVRRKRRRSVVTEIPLLLAVALAIALILKTFLVQAFVIPSGSMEQTIRIQDRVLVDKFTPWFGSRAERGDVVVFKDPGGWLQAEAAPAGNDDPVVVKQIKQGLTFIGVLPSDDEQDLIKRVVAVGGDTVKCCDPQGRITVNGVPLSEPYLHPGNTPSDRKFEVAVPPGRLFVLGDHRSNSADSRAHLDGEDRGTVSEDEVVGRAVVIAWPMRHWRTLEERETFASVPDAAAGSTGSPALSNSLSYQDRNGMVLLPTPAELPLVMGVVGLLLVRSRRFARVRSGCGGRGGRRTVRTRAAGGTAGESRRDLPARDGRRSVGAAPGR